MKGSPPSDGRYRTTTASVLLWISLLSAGSLSTAHARAMCLSSADPQIRQLETLVAKDGAKAVEEVRARLAVLETSPQLHAARIAELYGVLAQGYSLLELDAEARAAALAGLKFAPRKDHPVHLSLLSMHAENVYDELGIAAAIGEIEATRALQRPGSLADTCLLITLGTLQHRQNRPDLAVMSLTQAYRATMRPGMEEQRVLAAAALSAVMRSLDDFTQALALNQEVIDWDTAHEAWLSLSVSRFLQGEIFRAMDDYAAAMEQFTLARELSVRLDDRQGIAFADLRMCHSQIELGELALARRLCESALRRFSATQSNDVLKEAQSLLARIDLAEGRPERALASLNEVLDQEGADMPPRRIAPLYELRARTNAALHNYRDAYDDLEEYLQRYIAVNDAQHAQHAAALRARFETDREIERNQLLQRELDLTRERSERQKTQLQWIAAAVAAGAFVIALLTYILIANLRYRRQLVRLATQDSLTSLPNRRRTAELASAALEHATASHKPLTVALIDLDYFKSINDRCGHAAGDCVLQEFARIGRESLRASDILGRWGGEEFLLVLPDTTLDTALASLERLRALALGIRLPDSGAGLRVSLSAGLASNEEGVNTLDDIIARADAALYEAKRQGRDLVRIAEESYRMASTGVRRALQQTSFAANNC